MGRRHAGTGEFIRRLRPRDLRSLKRDDLFRRELRGDRSVFPAIRKDRVDFYYNGGKLFSYQRSQFRTHIKYASVMRGARSAYVTEAQLGACEPIEKFVDGYKDIKRNCRKLSGRERRELSKLHAKYSLVAERRKSRVVVIDIEAAFSRVDREEGEGPDMIDLVLFDTESGEIRFVEGKRLDDPRLRARRGDPEVVGQMRRYQEQLGSPERREQLVTQYGAHVAAMNELYDLRDPLPSPLTVHKTPGLFIFDYRGARSREAKKCMAQLKGSGVRSFAATKADTTIDTIYTESFV